MIRRQRIKVRFDDRRLNGQFSDVLSLNPSIPRWQFHYSSGKEDLTIRAPYRLIMPLYLDESGSLKMTRVPALIFEFFKLKRKDSVK